MDLHFNSDIVNLLLKTNGGEIEGLIFFFFFFFGSLECSNCRRVGGGGLEQKVLFRAG